MPNRLNERPGTATEPEGRAVAVATAKLQAPSDDKRWRIVDTRMRRLGQRPDALIEVLHSAQEAFGFLDTDALGLRRRRASGCR